MSIIKSVYEYAGYLSVGLVFGVGAGYLMYNLVEFLAPIVKG